MDYVGFGRRIRAQRKKQKLTQESLAERVGISLSFLGHIERGTRKASLETLIAIANVLLVSVDALLQDSLDASIVETHSQISKNQRELINEIAKVIICNYDR